MLSPLGNQISYGGYPDAYGIGYRHGGVDNGSYTGVEGLLNEDNSKDRLTGNTNSADKAKGPEDCETCKNRKYKDGSDENVSFKSPSHISPEAAGAAVRGHEQEHVNNAYGKAAQKGGEVVQASVAIHTSVCPECGRTYVSGGTTTTQIKYPNEENPYQQSRKAEDAGKYKGMNMDLQV